MKVYLTIIQTSKFNFLKGSLTWMRRHAVFKIQIFHMNIHSPYEVHALHYIYFHIHPIKLKQYLNVMPLCKFI